MTEGNNGDGTPTRGSRGRGRGGRGVAVQKDHSTDGFSYGKLTVTNYVCNICGAQYRQQCNLLTHQVRVHGREKKRGTGRRPKALNPLGEEGLFLGIQGKQYEEQYEQGQYEQGQYEHGQYEQGKYEQGQYEQELYEPGQYE